MTRRVKSYTAGYSFVLKSESGPLMHMHDSAHQAELTSRSGTYGHAQILIQDVKNFIILWRQC